MKVTLKDVDAPDITAAIERAVRDAVANQLLTQVKQVIAALDIEGLVVSTLHDVVRQIVGGEVRSYLATQLDQTVQAMLVSELGDNWRQKGMLESVVGKVVTDVLASRGSYGKD